MICQQQVFRASLAFMCAACAMAVSASGLDWRDTSPSMRWAYDLHENERGVLINVHDLDMEMSEGEHGTVLEPTGPVAWPDFGMPRLPMIVLLFAVPGDEAYEVSWTASSSMDQPVPLLAPVPTPIAEPIDDETSRTRVQPLRDEAVYARDAYWPGSIAQLEEARGADIRFLRVEIAPLQYNAATGLLRTHRGLSVVLSKVASTERTSREDGRDGARPSVGEYNTTWRAELRDAGSLE